MGWYQHTRGWKVVLTVNKAVTTDMTVFQDDKACMVCKHLSNIHIYQRVAIRKIPKNCKVYI